MLAKSILLWVASVLTGWVVAQPYYPSEGIPRFAQRGAAVPIACEGTPFGSHSVILSDFEGVHFVRAFSI